MIITASLTSKGQLTLPKKIREDLQAESGDTIIFELVNDQWQIRKAKSIESLFNTLPPLPGSLDNLEKVMTRDIWQKK